MFIYVLVQPNILVTSAKKLLTRKTDLQCLATFLSKAVNCAFDIKQWKRHSIMACGLFGGQERLSLASNIFVQPEIPVIVLQSNHLHARTILLIK